ncbi:hypothetical protein CBR_g40224 [Chara braunii]|uniref:Integrase catalytic domain-containing protein n=1 Tax=Chara braunii TaxID=69332 RepID=A0A388K1Q3_CHABU|nr:hypothetical protein CBR_g40224 [Chara braunii]|eukprot:GBG63981.1 hypothetical protein CBR_g40224 [Chara braunii]
MDGEVDIDSIVEHREMTMPRPSGRGHLRSRRYRWFTREELMQTAPQVVADCKESLQKGKRQIEFRFEFQFAPNPYFHEKLLVKEVYTPSLTAPMSMMELRDIPPIRWKSTEMNLCVRQITKCAKKHKGFGSFSEDFDHCCYPFIEIRAGGGGVKLRGEQEVGPQARMIAKVEVELSHASGRTNNIVVGDLGGGEQLIPAVLMWMTILLQDSLERIVHLLVLSIGLWVECSAILERGSVGFKEVFLELWKEARITVADDVLGETVMACDMVEEENGDVLGGVRCGARDEVGAFSQAANFDIDAIMSAVGVGETINEVHGDGLPPATEIDDFLDYGDETDHDGASETLDGGVVAPIKEKAKGTGKKKVAGQGNQGTPAWVKLGLDYKQEGPKLRPVEYMSKKMPSQKLAKSTYEKELYAIYKALTHWRHYLLGRFFYVRTDHQILKGMSTQLVLSDALKRWIEVIEQYDFEPQYIKGEYNKVADALSRRPDFSSALITEFGLADDVTRSMVEAYREDPFMSEIIRRLEAKDKVTSAEFELVNGLLFLEKAGNKRLCVPNRESLRSLFLGECHDATDHFGFKKTAANLLQRFWWPTIMRDAKLYVETCQVCQRDKPRTQAPLGLLKPLPIPERSGESLFMDFMDTLVTSKSGMRHIFVIVDRFSKYASELWKVAAAEQGTQLQMTSGNHPEAYGQEEQLNHAAVEQMHKAHAAMIEIENKHRRPSTFQVGEGVWVKSSELGQEYGISRKLMPQYFGPWEILDVVGEDPDGPSYVVRISGHLRTYPVFHASKLAPFEETDQFPSRRSMLPPTMDGEVDIDDIVDHQEMPVPRLTGRGRPSKPKLQYRVRLRHHTDSKEDRWFTREELMQTAPQVVAQYEKFLQKRKRQIIED